MDFILIGHRTSGKTTLAGAIAQLHPQLFEVIDLDHVIETQEERTCAQIIADYEPYFRELERAYLDKILEQPSRSPHRIIVPGAGCSHLPTGPLYIWLRRDGWVDTAHTQRARLKPRQNFDEEVAWMRRTREPRWAARAHTVLGVARGTEIATTLQRLSERLLAMIQMCGHATLKKTYLVPGSEAQLERAIYDARTLQAAGLEIRSDIFTHNVGELAAHTPVLASLRTPDANWLSEVMPHASAIDVDITHIDVFNGALTSPRTLIVSHHPKQGSHEELDALLKAADDLAAHYPEWDAHIVIKYAPCHDHPAEILATLERMQAISRPVTYLPQGPQWAWMRPWLVAHLNHTNYLPVLLHAHTTGMEEAAQSPAAMDLHEWMPHLCAQQPSVFDALLGDPVHQSVGDWWHRMTSLREVQAERSYLKIPISRELDSEAWQEMLALLHAMSIHGLSITSPHKRLMPTLPAVTTRDSSATQALNTLGYSPHDALWHGIDTDHTGMVAVLDELVARDITPGDVVVIGQGGVSPALVRALDARPEWSLVHHASARQGWTDDTPAQATLIINAAGGHADTPYHHPPSCLAWVDLHYTNVRTPPACEVHLNGDVFFAAQARAQRLFWATLDTKEK